MIPEMINKLWPFSSDKLKTMAGGLLSIRSVLRLLPWLSLRRRAPPAGPPVIAGARRHGDQMILTVVHGPAEDIKSPGSLFTWLLSGLRYSVI